MVSTRNDRISAAFQEMMQAGGVAIADPAISGGTIDDATITDANIDDADIDGGTIDGVEVTGELVDSTTFLVDDVDPTKRLKFELGGQTTGTDRTLTPPNADDTIMGLATAQTVTGAKTFADGAVKINGATSGAITLKAPAVASTYVHTLPAATDTLVGKDTTDVLTNKSLKTDTCFIVDPSDVTKKIKFDASGITTATTRTYTLPDANATLAATFTTGVTGKGAAAAGAAGAVTYLTVLKTGIADNTPTDCFTITVPNGTIAGGVFVKAVGALGDCDSSQAVTALIAISRIAGAGLAAAVALGSDNATVTTGAQTASVDISRGSTVGAVGVTQTFTVRVTVARSGGASTDHTACLELTLINNHASGITVAAA